MMDEMAIRQQIEWNKSKQKFIGYVDFGSIIDESENLPVAKYALVYMLTGINQRWKIPVAYFFVNLLTAEERANITRKVLEFVATSGVNVIAMTFDGLSANISMCNKLNANIYNGKSFFCIQKAIIIFL